MTKKKQIHKIALRQKRALSSSKNKKLKKKKHKKSQKVKKKIELKADDSIKNIFSNRELENKIDVAKKEVSNLENLLEQRKHHKKNLSVISSNNMNKKKTVKKFESSSIKTFSSDGHKIQGYLAKRKSTNGGKTQEGYSYSGNTKNHIRKALSNDEINQIFGENLNISNKFNPSKIFIF